MDPWFVPIIVAVIAGPLMWALRKLDRNNSVQHAQNLEALTELKEDVKEVVAEVREVKADVRDLRSDQRILWKSHQTLQQQFDEHKEVQ
jgi:hypothetical protein